MIDIERGGALDRFSRPMAWEYSPEDEISLFDEVDLNREIEQQIRLEYETGRRK